MTTATLDVPTTPRSTANQRRLRLTVCQFQRNTGDSGTRLYILPIELPQDLRRRCILANQLPGAVYLAERTSTLSGILMANIASMATPIDEVLFGRKDCVLRSFRTFAEVASSTISVMYLYVRDASKEDQIEVAFSGEYALPDAAVFARLTSSRLPAPDNQGDYVFPMQYPLSNWRRAS